MSAKGSKRPLIPEIILFTIFILDELVVLLVDGIVCQVHVFVVFIDFRGVSFTCESGKTFLEDIHTEWFVTSDEDIYSQVEFVTVNQKRVGYIP